MSTSQIINQLSFLSNLLLVYICFPAYWSISYGFYCGDGPDNVKLGRHPQLTMVKKILDYRGHCNKDA